MVEYESFPLELDGQRTTQRNVIATLPGIGRTKRIVYVVAHYDSRTDDPSNGSADAPGADDNGSGVAAALELARIMSGRQWDATVRFLLTSGAESDLSGARYHATRAREVGLPVVGVVNLDIVGGARGPDGTSDPTRLRVFSTDPAEGPFGADWPGTCRPSAIGTASRRCSSSKLPTGRGARATTRRSPLPDSRPFG